MLSWLQFHHSLHHHSSAPPHPNKVVSTQKPYIPVVQFLVARIRVLQIKDFQISLTCWFVLPMRQSYEVCFPLVHICGVNVVHFCVVPSKWRYDECRKADIVGLSPTCGDWIILPIYLSSSSFLVHICCVNLVHIRLLPYIYISIIQVEVWWVPQNRYFKTFSDMRIFFPANWIILPIYLSSSYFSGPYLLHKFGPYPCGGPVYPLSGWDFLWHVEIFSC